MGAPFSDITLYTPIPHKVGTPEYMEDTSLQNFISDLYVQKMRGYKPPKTSRVTILPEFHNIWQGSKRFGSIVSIAPYYSYDDFKALDKLGKYQYTLDLIQDAMLQLSDWHGWDKTVFEAAYTEVLANDFQFKVDSLTKLSRDKRKVGRVSIEKTEIVTSLFVDIEGSGTAIKRKLFDKKNTWWYDCAYLLARHTKWMDNDRFGINYGKGQLEIWYSIEQDEVALFENSNRVTEINFRKHFFLQ